MQKYTQRIELTFFLDRKNDEKYSFEAQNFIKLGLIKTRRISPSILNKQDEHDPKHYAKFG